MHLVIDQKPIAKARHRHFTRGDRVITFDPQSVDKNAAKSLFANQMRGNGDRSFTKQALSMELMVYSQIPQSLSKVKQSALEGQPKITKPDLDNYIKFYSDVLNEVAYEDDNQITRIWSEKLYSARPRVEIIIQPFGASMINEHAITVKSGDLTMDQLDYLVKKANKIGLQKRQVVRVYVEEDSEGRHIYFEAEGLRPCISGA